MTGGQANDTGALSSPLQMAAQLLADSNEAGRALLAAHERAEQQQRMLRPLAARSVANFLFKFIIIFIKKKFSNLIFISKSSIAI
jgi:hypothetical protein